MRSLVKKKAEKPVPDHPMDGKARKAKKAAAKKRRMAKHKPPKPRKTFWEAITEQPWWRDMNVTVRIEPPPPPPAPIIEELPVSRRLEWPETNIIGWDHPFDFGRRRESYEKVDWKKHGF
jgi:hypothetical protein